MDITVAQTLRTTLPSSSQTDLATIKPANTSESTGRCLRAATNLKKNDLVMCIPISHTVQAKSLQRLLQHLGSDIKSLPPLARLDVPFSPLYKKALVLLYAKTCDSNATDAGSGSNTGSKTGSVFGLKEYVATLPTSFNHMPLFWNNSQIDRLGPLLSSTLYNFVQRMNNEIDRAHFDLEPIVRHLIKTNILPHDAINAFTLDFLRWVYCCLTSRTFDLTLSPSAAAASTISTTETTPTTQTTATTNEEDDTATAEDHGLVPFMDLMNHASTPSEATLAVIVEILQDDGEGEGKQKETNGGNMDVSYVTARATRDLQQDEELCFSYRMKGEALKFLFNYGFVPEDAKDVFYLMVKYDTNTLTNTDNTDNTKDGNDGENEDENVDHLLGSALLSLGLPATKTLAIPMTDEDPLPELYIWALRVLEMHLDEKERQSCLESFQTENIRLLKSHEENVWKRIAENIECSYEFYTKEEEIKKDNKRKEGYEDVFVHRTRDAAVRILEKSMAKFGSLMNG